MARLFQSTQPSQAVTIDRVDALKDSYEFQSTQPSQAVTNLAQVDGQDVSISIHTALAGCDERILLSLRIRWISIHTALAGCDVSMRIKADSKQVFQSTQPSQAVTD